MLKPVITSCIAIAFLCASAAAAQRPEVRYKYDDRDFSWDKRQLDTPPLPVGGQVSLTRYLDYPRELRRRRVEGKSIASVSVDATGRVTSVAFVPRMDRQLEAIVRRAVMRCRWTPGKKSKRIKAGTVSFPITFVISAA